MNECLGTIKIMDESIITTTKCNGVVEIWCRIKSESSCYITYNGVNYYLKNNNIDLDENHEEDY